MNIRLALPRVDSRKRSCRDIITRLESQSAVVLSPRLIAITNDTLVSYWLLAFHSHQLWFDQTSSFLGVGMNIRLALPPLWKAENVLLTRHDHSTIIPEAGISPRLNAVTKDNGCHCHMVNLSFIRSAMMRQSFFLP